MSSASRPVRPSTTASATPPAPRNATVGVPAEPASTIREPPALLEGRGQGHPGRGEQGGLLLLGHEAPEVHPLGDVQLRGEFTQVRLPPALSGDDQT